MKIILVLSCLLVAIFSNPDLDRHLKVIHEVNSLNAGGRAELHPKFAKATIEDLKKQMGTILQTPPHLQLPPKFDGEYNADEATPEEFDSRTAWPNCESIKEIRDQSSCGSCGAFGAVEAMSDRLCIASGQKNQTRISATDLLACCGSCGFGCNGGYPSAAGSYFKNTGIVSGDLYNTSQGCEPYPFAPCAHHLNVSKLPACPSELYPTPSCSKKCQGSYPFTYAQDKIKGKSSYSVSSNEETIRKEIIQYGPVTAAFTVYEDFMWYTKGVYVHVAGSNLGGHAIKLIGFGIENNQKYGIAVNSGNDEGGLNGTFKILRGSNHCGIEGSIVAGNV